MKSLILVRHAKSSWSNPGLSDIKRPLNQRGQQNAPMMGKILKNKYGINPDLIISSPAERAFRTAEIISEKLDYPLNQIQTNKKVYSALKTELLKIIQSVDEKINILMMFGHNPEFTELSNYLSGSYIDNIPTCGIVKLDFKTMWNDVSEKSCTIDFFIYPRLFTSEEKND